MKKITYTTGEKNLMAKFGLDIATVDAPNDRTIYNMFGAEALVNEFVETLYVEVLNQYARYEAGDFKAVTMFDRLKYLLCKIRPDVYSNLIN